MLIINSLDIGPGVTLSLLLFLEWILRLKRIRCRVEFLNYHHLRYFWVVAKEGGPRGVRANVVCPGFVRTPLVDKQIPEQAKALGISEEEVVKNVMLKETVDGEFTTVEDVANTVAFLAGFESSALTGQSVIVSHGWSMK